MLPFDRRRTILASVVLLVLGFIFFPPGLQLVDTLAVVVLPMLLLAREPVLGLLLLVAMSGLLARRVHQKPLIVFVLLLAPFLGCVWGEHWQSTLDHIRHEFQGNLDSMVFRILLMPGVAHVVDLMLALLLAGASCCIFNRRKLEGFAYLLIVFFLFACLTRRLTACR